MDLEAIKKRCEAATEGPWEFVRDKETSREWLFFGPTRYKRFDTVLFDTILSEYRDALYSAENGLEFTDADFEFIAHARQDVPALIEYIEELETKLAALSAEHRR